MYSIFRIQLALDIVSANAKPSSRSDVRPLIRTIPNVTTVPHGMHVQWFVHQEEPVLPLLAELPESNLVWEVLFNGTSPFRDGTYRCTLRTTAIDFKTPLVHSAEAAPVRVEDRGEFEYDVRLADDSDRTISLERSVLIVP